MAYFRCGGGGVPASVKTDMNAVLNKKFGTSTDYPPADWAPTVNLMGPLPERTVSGSIAHITDGADRVPIKSWEVEIAPTLTGKTAIECDVGTNNFFDDKHLNVGLPATSIGSSIDTINTSATRYTYNGFLSPRSNIAIKGSRNDTNVVGACLFFGYKDGLLTDYRSINPFGASAVSINCSNFDYIRISIGASSGYQAPTDMTSYGYVSAEYGTTFTEYVQADTTVSTVNLGRTIHGGNVDVVNGTGKDNRLKYELDETDSWGAYSGTTHSFWHNVATGEDRPIKQTEVTTSICNELAYSSNTPATAPDFSFCIQGGQRIVVTADSTIDTVDKFKTWLSSHNLVFVCPATTPTDFTFTPITPIPETALGVNNFWADEGDSTVVYRADIDLLLGGN